MLDFEADMDELSNIGDNFVNLIYSLALSNAMKRPMGVKVSNYVLSEALLNSGFRDRAGKGLDKHDMADFVESIIFFAWTEGKVTIDECVGILTDNIEPTTDRYRLRRSSIAAFTELLKRIGDLIWTK
ncbi:MAG: ribonuclease III family protein [Candidatus Hydrothermarchaeales archaeon]